MGKYILSEFSPSVLPKFEFQIITASKAIASYLKVPHYSLESLARNIVRRQGIGIASALLSRRLLQNAVLEVIDTRDIEGTATAFLSTVREVLRSGIDLNELQQDPDWRIEQLGRLVAAYQSQLRQLGRIDAAELYWQGVRARSPQKAYIFYGYFTPAPDELALVDAIAGEDSILLLPLNDLYPQNLHASNWLQSQGWELLPSSTTVGIGRQLQQCFTQPSVLPTEVSLNVFADLEAEIRGVLAQIKVLLSQGIASKNIVVVTSDEQLYGSLAMDIAWEYNLPIEVCYEIPLTQTRLGGWLNLLLEVIRDDFPFEATAKLLSHPLANCLPDELWSQARQTHPHGLQAWQDLGVDLSFLNFKPKHRRDWIAGLANILSTWEVLEKAKFWAKETVAYYRLQEGLQELSQPEQQQLNKQSFIQEITETLSLLTVPAQPGRGGIELHCPTSLLGTNYSHVFVLGAVSGILPPAIADNPILDVYHRKQLAKRGLNLENAVDLAQKATFNFYCLLNVPTQSITFSYPEAIADRPTIPSPYLSRLGLQPSRLNLPIVSLERARQLYLRQPSSSSLVPPEVYNAWQVETRRESAIAPDLYDGVIGVSLDPRQKTFSASQLTQLGQCPFKWFSARLLKLQELVEAESDLNPAIRGNLYHRCLELSLSEIKTASDLAKFNREQLTQAFATAERELNLTELPGWEAQRIEHLNLLALNLTTQEFLPPEREVIATETKFDSQWYGLQVRGQVDRIDRTEAGLLVIDYKSSGVVPPGAKDDTGRAKLDIQLAVYQDAIAKQYPQETIDSAAYYSLTKQKINRPQKDPTKLAAFAERVKSHLERGFYPVAPDLDRLACRYCNYDLVCRKGDRLSRKPN